MFGIETKQMEHVASFLGLIASFCFIVQYAPQAWLNYRRKHVRGFSKMGIVIKHIGASFLWINSMILGETFAVQSYGMFNVLQHSIFMLQFSVYGDEVGSKGDSRYLLWIFFPIIPIYMGLRYPQTIPITNSAKPIAQILSHLPQLLECIRLRTTLGCSLLSQHLNFIGGVLGLYMCYWIPPRAYSTYLIYLNSVLQAVSIYILAFSYGEFFNRSHFSRKGDNEWGNGETPVHNSLELSKV
jgi:uncharacterized protein with PQ loop repeat